MSLIAQQTPKKSAAFRVTALASIMLSAAVTLTACGGGEHEAKAVDKLDEAAEMAKANAPKPEPLKPEDIAPASSAPAATDAAEGTATADAEGTATADAAGTDAAAPTAEGAATTTTDAAATTDSATAPATTDTTADAAAPAADMAPEAKQHNRRVLISAKAGAQQMSGFGVTGCGIKD